MTTSLSQLHISFSIPLLILAGVILIAFAFTVYIYRNTNPIVDRSLKRLLTAIRISAVILILLVFAESVLQLQYNRTEAPVLAVAVDQSASMSIRDQNGLRSETVKKILQDKIWKGLGYELSYFTFSGTSQSCSSGHLDSLSFNGDVTDLTQSLESIKGSLAEKNLAGIVLITDGNYNSGGNPTRYAGEIGIPIYPVAIGSAQAVPDLAIMDLEANAFAYTEEATPVKATIRNTGFKESRTLLSLKSDSKTESTKMISIASSPSETAVTIDYTPQTSGRQKLVLTIATREGEQTTENNRRTFYMDVMKSRLKIFMLSGAVAPEISFLRRYLTSGKRYDLHILVEKKDGGFYESSELGGLDNADMFIFQNFPTRTSDHALLQRILQVLRQKQIPLLLFGGADLDLQQLQPFQDYLPFHADVEPASVVQVYPVLAFSGKTHPVLQFGGDLDDIWSQLPPVPLSLQSIQVWPNSEILITAVTSRLTSRNNDGWPLLLVRSMGAHKSAALLSHDNWRWDMLMWGINRPDEVYNRLINNLARWLESTQSADLVRIETAKNHYKYGEPVEIQVKVFNEKYLPLSTADVVLEVKKNTIQTHYQASPVGEGAYSVTLYPDQPGDYSVRAVVHENDRPLGNAQTLLSVGEYSLELSDTQAQLSLLSALADASDGFYMPPDALGQLADHLKGNERHSSIVRDLVIWNHPAILFFIIALLSIEWYIRKKKGMV